VSRAGRHAFLDRYNWDHTSTELVELYRRLQERAPRGRTTGDDAPVRNGKDA
jgi:hypothetical protein